MNWLLLRGLVRESRHWMDFPSRLESRFPGHRAYCLDLPGLGTEYGRPSPRSISEIRLDLQKRFEALSRGADQKPWNLLTISLGSMVGLDWVNKDPTRFERLVVMNTSCANLCLPQERLRPQRLAELLRIRALRDDPVRREREILKLTTATRHRLEELSEQWGAWAKEKPLRVTVAAAQLWAALRFLTPRRISVPLLVLAGAQDHFVNPVCSKSIADFYKAPFFVHPFGGHDLFLDDPNWILDRLSDWIST